jgi:hypothetical protein
MLITTHNLHSEAHFHRTLSIRVQVSVHHTGQQVITHILFVNFIQLQYVIPFSRTSKSLAVYCNPTSKIQCTERMTSPSAHSWALCKNKTRKYRNKTVIHMVNVLHYIFNARWTPLVTQSTQSVHCWSQYIGQLLIISSDLNVRGLEKPWRWMNLEDITPSAYVPPSVCETKSHAHTKEQAKVYLCIS